MKKIYVDRVNNTNNILTDLENSRIDRYYLSQS